MTAPALRTFVVRLPGSDDPIEVEAKRAEQDANSTRVTFYGVDDTAVASFINVSAWYAKPETDERAG